MPTGIFTKEHRIQQIREEVSSGNHAYLEDLSEAIGLQPRTIRRYTLKLDIPLPPLRDKVVGYGNIAQNPFMDELIAHGRYQSLLQVAQEYVSRRGGTMSHERVRQYIGAWELQGVFDESREGYRQEQGRIAGGLVNDQGIGSILNGLILKKRAEANEQEKFAWNMAVRRVNETSLVNAHNLLPFRKTYGLMMDYWQVREDGRNKSLDAFADDNGMHFVTVGGVFRGLGLPSLGGKKMFKKRVATPQWKKNAIDRSYDGFMSFRDIAHFLEMPYWNVKDRFLRTTNTGKSRSLKTVTGLDNKVGPVNYKLASEVYEFSRDFTDDEVEEVLGIESRQRDWYRQNARWIEPDIIGTLKFLYSGQEVSKPWVTPNLRAFDGVLEDIGEAA